MSNKRKYIDITLEETDVITLYKSSKERKLSGKYRFDYDENITHSEDKLWCQKIVTLYNEINIDHIENSITFPLDIVSIICQFAVGFIESCPQIDCIDGEVFILPSELIYAMNHSYQDDEMHHYCNNADCNVASFVHPCASCNSFILSLQKLTHTKDIGHPLSPCIACSTIYRDNELCSYCYYICHGCGNRCCYRYHNPFICSQCLNKYCPLCDDFMEHSYKLISTLNIDLSTNLCIICHCDLSALKQSTVDGLEYFYEFDHFKDRFTFWFLIQIIENCTLVQNLDIDINLITLIAHYANGFHFIDPDGQHFVMNVSSQQQSEQCCISSTCEISLLYEDIIPYSPSNSFDCMASIISMCGTQQSLQFTDDIKLLQNLYESGECTWNVYFCDKCHYQVFASKFDYNQLPAIVNIYNPLPDDMNDHICNRCYIDDGVIVKLCHSLCCSFKCATCASRQCNTHLLLKCNGCGLCFCMDCVHRYHNYESFMKRCNICEIQICFFCQTFDGESLEYTCTKCTRTPFLKQKMCLK